MTDHNDESDHADLHREAEELRRAGLSYREIAGELGVEEALVRRLLSLYNPDPEAA